MAKSANAVLIAVVAVVAVALLVWYLVPKHPYIATIHVINLDRDKKRWESIQSQAATLGLKVQRFPATYGKDIPYSQMRTYGVGNAMVRADRHDHKGEKLHNLGVVGCYISHRSLLETVANLDVPESAGHLILEDDVKFPADFLQPGGRWDTLSQHIPNNWDVIWLRMWKVHGDDVAPGVVKLKTDTRIRVNLGTFAYVVRHGSLKSKILPHLKLMNDAFDEQMNLKFNDWNCYVLNPGMIEIDDDLQKASAINAINTAS
jgi:GR25 family glycosyltransferase involved in LPS biosynthesis